LIFDFSKRVSMNFLIFNCVVSLIVLVRYSNDSCEAIGINK